MSKTKKPRTKKPNARQRSNRQNQKQLRHIMPGVTLYYCDTYGIDTNGALKMKIEGEKYAEDFFSFRNQTLSDATQNNLWNWHITTFCYCDDGEMQYSEISEIYAKSEKAESINEEATHQLTQDTADVNAAHIVALGWVARIMPDNWKAPTLEQEESEPSKLALQNQLTRYAEAGEIELLEKHMTTTPITKKMAA